MLPQTSPNAQSSTYPLAYSITVRGIHRPFKDCVTSSQPCAAQCDSQLMGHASKTTRFCQALSLKVRHSAMDSCMNRRESSRALSAERAPDDLGTPSCYTPTRGARLQGLSAKRACESNRHDNYPIDYRLLHPWHITRELIGDKRLGVGGDGSRFQGSRFQGSRFQGCRLQVAGSEPGAVAAPSLELGTWNLELGTWNLELGTCNLGTWNLQPWNLELGTQPGPRYSSARIRAT